MFQNASSLKPLGQLKPNCPGMIGPGSHIEYLTGTKNSNFVEDHPRNIPVKFGSNRLIKAKLYMNVHWMVLYNLKVFCSNMKFKMAATAGLSLTSMMNIQLEQKTEPL
jgi:hypothetical protein